MCADIKGLAHGNLSVGHEQFFIDAFNVFLVTLTAFVGLTTSLFSRPYMRIEAEHGRVVRRTTALVSQHVPAVHGNHADCPPDQQHGAYLGCDGSRDAVHRAAWYPLSNPRRHEAGWKYFILCGVGIAQALFGTILSTLPQNGCSVPAAKRAPVDKPEPGKSQLEPTVLRLAFVFLMVGYGTKVGLVPLHNWLPDAHVKVQRRFPRSSPACC